jgi:hypothetical protein
VDQKRPAASGPKRSDRFLWFALIVLGCVSVYSVSFAVGLLIPRWNNLTASRQQAAYHPPKAPLDAPDATRVTRDTASVRTEQNPLRDVQPNPEKGEGAQGAGATSTISSRAPTTLPATPSQEADLNSPKGTRLQDMGTAIILTAPARQSPAATQDTALGTSRDKAVQEHDDAPATTSGLASVAPSLSSKRYAAHGSELNPPVTPSQNPNASAPPAPTSRGIQTTQNSPPPSPSASPAVPPKRHAPSESSQKMWYK